MGKFLRAVIAMVGAAFGAVPAWLVNMYLTEKNALWFNHQTVLIYFGFIILCGIIFLIFSKAIIHFIMNMAGNIERQLQEVPMAELIKGAIGLTIGLFIAFLLSSPITKAVPSGIAVGIVALLYLLLGYLGVSIVTKRWTEINWYSMMRRQKEKQDQSDIYTDSVPKILDTSVIIDGRIFDICKTGFIEGPLVIPGFVLKELRHIADSADDLKRNRGRRGLDILKMIQQELDIKVVIDDTDFEEVEEVDAKLLKLGQKMSARVVTNDYNLNKVAEVQGVLVLNINELANAVKPVVLPGEKMQVQIIKEGKENGQGIGYLDDGTMIVVEEGHSLIGKMATVTVTSVLQTSAGRMIFAKPRLAAKGA